MRRERNHFLALTTPQARDALAERHGIKIGVRSAQRYCQVYGIGTHVTPSCRILTDEDVDRLAEVARARKHNGGV